MKKISFIIISIALLINITACSGYKPIFGSSNIEFTIAEHSIIGDKKIGNQIYSKLYNLSQSNNSEGKNIYILINASKNKNATAKDSAGKAVAYKISLTVDITVKDFLTDELILKEKFVSSASYKVQDQYSQTIKSENRSTENLINKTYQDLLIKLSENIL